MSQVPNTFAQSRPTAVVTDDEHSSQMLGNMQINWGVVALVLVLHGMAGWGLMHSEALKISPPMITLPLEVEIIPEVKPIEPPKPLIEKLVMGEPPVTPPPVETKVTKTPPKDVPSKDVPPKDVPPKDIPPKDVPPKVVPPKDVPPKVVPPKVVPPKDVPPKVVPPKDVPPKDVPPKTTVGNADWVKRPDMSGLGSYVGGIAKGTRLTVSFRLTVAPNGRITGANLVKSSGYTNIDNLAQQRVRQGRMNTSSNIRTGTLSFAINVTAPPSE